MKNRSMSAIRTYGAIPVLSLLAGGAAMFLSHYSMRSLDEQTEPGWPQVQLHAAAAGALSYKHEHGVMPRTLDELRAAPDGPWLSRSFELRRVLYFRDDAGLPRLSWRDDDDHASAYCSLDAAIHERC